MIKTIVTPQNNSLHLSIADSYVGKEIEVLVYTKEEAEGEKVNKSNNAAHFKGLLNKEEAYKYHIYLKQARSEWDRNL